MPVLILDGDSRAAIEALQSLGRAGLEVDVASDATDCLAAHSRYAVRILRQPSQDLAAFLPWLRAVDAERDYELIVPATESSLLGIRGLDPAGSLRRKAVLPGDEALDIALDKQRTWQVARELRVPVPQSVSLSSLDHPGYAGEFPLVLKPAHSKIMMEGELRTLSVAVVTNEAERREQLRRWLPWTPVLQQQYVPGRGIGLEFLFDKGRKVWHFAHERLHEFPLSGGASSYRRSIEPPAQILAESERLLTALRWHGVAMVEFKVDAGGRHWLMEINPRLWGSLALAIDAGMDFPMALLRLARGEPIPAQRHYRTHYYTRDLRTDAEWLQANLRADRGNRLLLTKSRLFSFVELLRPLTGRESWDHFDWRDLQLTQRILALTLGGQCRLFRRRLQRRRKKHLLPQKGITSSTH